MKLRMTHTRWLSAAIFSAAFLLVMKVTPVQAQSNCTDTPEGRVCQVQQPLVNGTLVPAQTQKDMGLVTVGNRCSGTLVNRSWVLTADHCVTSDGRVGTATDALANLTVTGVWTTRTAIPSRVVRTLGGLDVALMFLGRGDLGAANAQLFHVDPVETGQTITKYGRGIFGLAYTLPSGVAVPAQWDGLYRSAQFSASSASEDSITLPVNGAGQIGAGGDSGGPDIVTGPGGVSLGIAGVTSNCSVTYMAGQPRTWTWATNISSCNSAGLARIRFDLVNIISERPLVSNDFNDDNLPDIVWHNDATGETQIWFMSGSSRIGRATVVDEIGNPIMIGLPWRIVASRDFNRDNRTDILWYNNTTGELQVWFMAGTGIRSRATILGENGRPVFIGPPFYVVGANDMNGDRYADIVWHNDSTGETQLWLMNGTSVAQRATVLDENGLPALVGLPFSIVATDDMNRDGKPDFVWHNAASGETQIWYMNTNRLIGRWTVNWESNTGPALVGLPWRIVGTSDFDRDNLTDILWHNDVTGETQIWYMQIWYGDVRTIKSRATIDAARDGGGAFVGAPWRIMPH